MRTNKLFVLFIVLLVASCNQKDNGENPLFELNGQASGTIPIVRTFTRPNAGVYASGDTLDATIEFDQDIAVVGIPKIILQIGRYEKAANCAPLNTSTIKCSYTLGDNYSEPDLDLDGISFERFDFASGSIIGSVGGESADLSSVSADLSDITVHYSNFTNWLDANDSTTLFSDSGCSTGINDGENIGCWMDKKSAVVATSTGAAMPLYSATGGPNATGKVNFSRDHVAFATPVTIATNFTVIVLYDVTSYNSLNYIFSSANGTTDGVGMGFGGTWGGDPVGNGLFTLTRDGGVLKNLASTYEAPLNTWGLAAYSPSKIYINDNEVAGYAEAEIIDTPKSFTNFGRRNDLNACCDHMGNISEFMVFDKELNADQLQEVWCYLSDKYALNYTGC